jgi:microcystin-dependent protein
MSDAFVAEITYSHSTLRQGWAWCDGQLMPISQNTALFSLQELLTEATANQFRVADLQGCVPMHPGQGLAFRCMTSEAEWFRNCYATNQMPAHSHTLQTSLDDADLASILGRSLAKSSSNLYATLSRIL